MSIAGPLLPLHPSFEVHVEASHVGNSLPRVLLRGITRTNSQLQKLLTDAKHSDGLRSLSLVVASNDDQLPNQRTDYSYTLSINNNTATATCECAYGCLYALESFTQLVNRKTAELLGSHITISMPRTTPGVAS